MKIIIGLFAVLFSVGLYSAEPLIELKNYPSKSELAALEDNEELYAAKVLEFYKYAALYEAQLNSMGIKPEKPAESPSLEEIQDGETTILKKYYGIAKTLSEQLKKAPGGIYNAKYIDLKNKYKDAENQIFMLQDSVYWLSLNKKQVDFYKDKFPKMVAEIESLKFKIDSLYLEYNKKLWNAEDKLRNIYNHKSYKKPLVTGGITINQFKFNDDKIETDLSPAIYLNFSPESIFGFGKFFDIWAEYQMPKWKSYYSDLINNYFVVAEYQTNIYNTGLALDLPLSEIFKFNGFMLNLRLGGGLFWGNTRMMSSPAPKTDWDGYMFKGDIRLVNYSQIFPVGIVAGFNYFNFNKTFQLNQNYSYYNLGKIGLRNLYLGIEVPIVSSTFLLK